VPVDGEDPGAVLVVIDETDFSFDHISVSHDDDGLVLMHWEALPHALPIASWQRQLARNAGWHNFAKWHCHDCDSVCPGEASIVPAPCDFCGSYDVTRPPATTALRPPRLPYPDDLTLAFLEAFRPYVD
jgi:hypothetical protein